MEIVGYDSWKRPVYKDDTVEVKAAPKPVEKPVPHVNNYTECTPEEMAAWRQEDYWNRGDYDPLVMFVVIPTIVQVMCMGMMFTVMYINSIIF
jgi:hypothetical protein